MLVLKARVQDQCSEFLQTRSNAILFTTQLNYSKREATKEVATETLFLNTKKDK